MALPPKFLLDPDDFDVFLRFIPFIFLFISVEYSAIHVKHSAEKFFNKHGFERSIHDLEFLKKILYVGIPLMIIFVIITDRWFQSKVDFENYYLSPEYIFNGLTVGLAIILLSTISRLGVLLLKRGFRYQLAKVCFILIRKSNDEVKQIPLIILGINSYNLHLKRHFKLEISKPGILYSKFMSDSEQQRKSDLKLISDSFSGNDDFEPLRCFTKLLKIEPHHQFVTDSRFINNVKEWIPYVAATIAGIVGILQIVQILF